MSCFECKYENKCSGSVCYWEEKRAQRQAAPDYDVKTYVMLEYGERVDNRLYSRREVDEYNDSHPYNDTVEFARVTKRTFVRYQRA